MPSPENSLEKWLRFALYVMAFIYAVNFILLGFLIGPYDYNHLSGYYELAWRFWRSGGGIPEFNPYLCGGRTLGADPQLPIFHPLILLTPLIGPTWTVKFEMLCQLALGTFGLWKWLERLDVPKEGRLWGAFLFSAGGAVVTRFMVGHVTLGFYILSPLLFYFSDLLTDAKGRTFRRALFWYLLLFWYCAWYKPNFMIYFVPPLMLEHATRALFLRRPRILILGILGTLFSLLSTAVCWLPAWKMFQDAPRGDAVPFNHTPLHGIFANLLLPLKAIPYDFYGDNTWMPRHEFNLFIGPVGVALMAVGLWKVFHQPSKLRLQLVSLVVLAVFSGWVGMGLPLWGLTPELHSEVLKFWPGFSSIRIPPRFWFPIYVTAIVFSSIGFWTPSSGKMARAVWLFVGTVALIVPAAVNLSKTTALADQTQWSAPARYRDYVSWKKTVPDDSFREIRSGFGALYCVYNIEIYQSMDVTVGSALNVISDKPVDFHARWLTWNRIAFQADSKEPVTVKLNLNHSPYWHVLGTEAEIVSNRKERLSLKFSQPHSEGELLYEQPLARVSTAITFVTLFLFGLFSRFYLFRERKEE